MNEIMSSRILSSKIRCASCIQRRLVVSHPFQAPDARHACPPRRKTVLCASRDGKNPKDGKGKGLNLEKEAGAWRLSMNDTQIVIPESTVLMAGLALLGFGAVLGG